MNAKPQSEQHESEHGESARHASVMLAETMRFLAPERGGVFVDATLGLGGHAAAMLEANRLTRVVGIDRDAAALRIARERLAPFGERFVAVHARHEEISEALASLKIETVAGVLADLGVSSLQLDEGVRGFSFRFDAPLDMRMNAASDEQTAADLLRELSQQEIARIIYEYGEERHSRRIARRIVERREAGDAVETTAQLAELVASVIGFRSQQHRDKHKRDKRADIHPATRTFQALRIAVNRELVELESFIETSIALLQTGGRLVVISFHSLEDRIVKRALRRLSGICECDVRLPVCQCGARRAVEVLTKRPVTPGEDEMRRNPRARSAKLRACEKSAA